jgi:hypothetical protein
MRSLLREFFPAAVAALPKLYGTRWGHFGRSGATSGAWRDHDFLWDG